MKEILEKLKYSHEIGSFYTDIEDTGVSYTGYVSEVDDEYVLIAHISSRGLYDGFILREIDDIFQIETNSEYGDKIKKLYERKHQSHRKLDIKYSDNLLDSLLKYCCEKKIFVSIELSENDEYPTTGILQETGDLLTIQVYDNYGNKCSIAYVRKEDIVVLSVDTDREQDIALLS